MDEKNMSINEETIEKNRRWFDFFEYFPMMFSVILAVVMFFAGMVMFFLEIEPFIPLILWIVGGGCVLHYLCCTKNAFLL